MYHLCDVVFGGGLKLYLIWIYLCHIILFDHEHLLSFLVYIDLKIVWCAVSGSRPGPIKKGRLLLARLITIFR